ncbi:MAG: outer membrane lipoprotein LolB [Methylococcaceae bacterium]|nr:outer membrane lipoprotein LolB [Methylococcaceae bacterium]
MALILSACAGFTSSPVGVYSSAPNAHLYTIKSWHLEGRLAVIAHNDSWSASIDWGHLPDVETIKISGPLGQGAVAIELNPESVTIDRGGGDIQTSNQPQKFISQQLGLDVPLESLRFWAIGLPEASSEFQKTTDGFIQNGWLISYKEMQHAGNEILPRKMSVSKNNMRLKLIIDQWKLNVSDVN